MQEKAKIPTDILIFLVLFALIPFLMVPNLVYEYSTQKHLVFSLFMVVILIYYLFKYFSKPVSIKFTYPHIFLSFFSISSFLSLISVYMENKYYLPKSVGIAFYIVLIVFFSYVITTRFGKDFKFVEYGLFIFMVTGTVIAIDGLLNKFLGFDLFFGKYGDPSQRIVLRTTIGNPNFVSDYLAQLLPISIYFTLRKNTNTYIRIYALANVFIMYWVVLLAQTRSIYLATFVGLGFAIVSYLISNKKDTLKNYVKSKEFRMWLILVLSVLAFLFLMFNFETPFNRGGEVIAADRFAAMASVSSWDERSLSWLSAVKQFADENHKNHFIIGSGINTYPVYAVHYLAEVQAENPERFLYAWNNFKRAHNDYLQVLGETGILGFSSIVLMLVSLMVVYFKVLKLEKDDDNKILLFPLFGWSATIMVIHAFTEFAFHMHPNLILSVFILSSAVSEQFHPHVKSLNIKKSQFVIIPLVVVGVVASYYKINEVTSEALFVKGNREYNSMVSLINATESQIPNIISQLESQKSTLQKQLANYTPGSANFQRITQSINQIETQIEDYKNMQLSYESRAEQSYNNAFEYFQKSLKWDPNFGKSAFYLSQLLTSSIRQNSLTYEDLPKIFEKEIDGYDFIIEEFNGSLDLMPFPDNILRDTVEPIYSIDLSNNAKQITLKIQTLYDGINQLEYSYLSFNEKNAYRLIGRIYYNIVVLYEQLKNYIPLDKLEVVEELQNEAYSNFHHWEQQAIYILPGGWNRFPEWEDVYYEYLLLTARLINIYPQDELINKIIFITQKEGEADYYMAQKFRGIPDSSLKLLSELYSTLRDENLKNQLAENVVSNYEAVYNYYKGQKEEGSPNYTRYQDRIESFFSDYEFFTRRLVK